MNDARIFTLKYRIAQLQNMIGDVKNNEWFHATLKTNSSKAINIELCYLEKLLELFENELKELLR